MSRRDYPITPDIMLRAYKAGLFPMAEARNREQLYWLDPPLRGILPLDAFHLPRRLRRTALDGTYTVTVDRDFSGVIAGCAAMSEGREETWINHEIERLFVGLFEMGYGHSVESWQDGRLVGGLYGVAVGAVFFGESMFSRARDASKVALAHLVARLRLGGFRLLDSQYVSAHLTQFGAVEIPRDEYKARLATAIAASARWRPEPGAAEIAAEIRALGRVPASAPAACA